MHCSRWLAVGRLCVFGFLPLLPCSGKSGKGLGGDRCDGLRGAARACNRHSSEEAPTAARADPILFGSSRSHPVGFFGWRTALGLILSHLLSQPDDDSRRSFAEEVCSHHLDLGWLGPVLVVLVPVRRCLLNAPGSGAGAAGPVDQLLLPADGHRPTVLQAAEAPRQGPATEEVVRRPSIRGQDDGAVARAVEGPGAHGGP